MKKLLCLAIFINVIGCLCAQENIFKLNESGECVITEAIDNSLSQAECYQKAKEWLNSSDMNFAIVSDQKDQSINFSAAFNSASSYNPFAGSFAENLLFNCTIECKDNSLSYRIYDVQMQEIYAGYGTKNTVNPISNKIQLLEKAKTDIANAETNDELSKKERKNIINDSEEIIEEAQESLEKASEELQNRITKLHELLK
ncbi:MAG: hypothetical protein PHR20_02790 [Bacteroidales bacterium]|nr:hypothetical protein [Bacteroidales bacterium]